MKRTAFFIIFWIVFGAALVAASLLLQPDTPKALRGAMLGVGVGLAWMYILKLMVWRYEKKHPDALKQSQIDRKDERNQQMRWKAKGKSADIIQWFILGLAYVMILLDMPLWLIALTVGIYVLKSILEAAFFSRCQKEM